MNLVIVESPTKARTLSGFLPAEFKVLATMGHIRDLPEKRFGVKIKKINGLRIANYEFEPQYVVVPKKKEIIEKLKSEVRKAEKIYLATDPDREGEAIAYHVAVICSNSKFPDSLAGGQIPNSKFLRITFHEITRAAIEKALANPGEINLQLVDAQQARRVLDRIVGYKLSPLLWYKIRKGLSAGRVQSVAVRLIVEREREIEKFVPQEYWEIWVELRKHIGGLKEGVPTFLAKLQKINGQPVEIKNETQVKPIVEELKKANYEVLGVDRREVFQSPPPPFTTSTLQQKAAQILRFSSKKTMQIAQKLYEKGLITYHRTDSVALAKEAVEMIRDFIAKNYGKEFLPESPRVFKTKSKVAQEAHEAVRPTDVRQIPNSKFQIPNISNKDEEKLYELIWKRAVASQMAAAVWDQTKVEVQGTTEKNIYILGAEGKIIKFEGWLKIYEKSQIPNPKPQINPKSQIPNSKKENEEELPELKKGEDLDLIKVDPQQKFTQPPPRYTEASLIKTLEKLGIGRPSTYAPIVSTIQQRQYVEKKEGKFWPTPLGITVNDFLVEYFPDIVDYEFTAKMEDSLDAIARGEKKWQPVLSDFYGPFAQKLEGVIKAAEKVKVPVETTGEKCPKCKVGELVVRTGKFGKFIACSRFPECSYTTPYIEKVEGVKCPECGGEVVIRKGKNGKRFYGCTNWPKCKWASWKKPK
jgi:DNA topoisomerase-1